MNTPAMLRSRAEPPASTLRSRLGILGLLAMLQLSACTDSKHESTEADAGQDAGTAPKSTLRPALERPPVNGLPADLRPPR
jgi:hypothetical protein